jgi:predicted MFS family arabinose efflux permease
MAALLTLLRTRTVTPAIELVDADRAPTAAGGLIAFIGLIVLLQAAGKGVVRAFFNVYLDAGLDVSPAQIGAIIGAAQLRPVLAALVTPALMARWGAARTCLWATLGLVICLVPLALIPHWIAAGLGFMGVMAMGALIGPARTIFSQEAVAPSQRATMSAATVIGLALGWSTTAMAGGYVIVALGYKSLFLLGAGLTALAVVLLATYLGARVAAVARVRPT